MSKPATHLKPFNVRIGKYGGVSVDPEEFFADPEVQRQVKLMREYDILGKKHDPKKQSSGESE